MVSGGGALGRGGYGPLRRVRLPADAGERIEYWAQRAFREWALRPGPIWTYLTSMASPATFRSAVKIGLESLRWAR